MKTYRLAKKHFLSNVIECLLGTSFLLLAWLFLAFQGGEFGLVSLFFTIPIWFGLAAMWYFQLLRQVFEIGIRDDGLVEFRSWSGCRSVRATDMESIDSEYFSHGVIRVHHTGGTIRLMYCIDGLHEFIWTMRSLNPRLGTFDC